MRPLRLQILVTLCLSLWVAAQATDYNYETNNGAIAITKYIGPGGVVIIPDTINGLPVTSIGDSAFQGCTNLTSVTIPNSVTNIGSGAFNRCVGLTSVTIPNSVTTIGDSAFHGCTSLTNVTIGNSVTSIGFWAFYDCISLTNITIPNSVTNIGDELWGHLAFRHCSSLAAIIVDTLNPIYSSMDGVLFDKDKTTLVECPGGKAGSYTIPDDVASIGYRAFYGCTNLTSVTIPNSVTNIGFRAFEACTGLTSITFPERLATIESYAFDSCSSLAHITIPKGVTNIGEGTFRDCTDLQGVYFKGNPPSIVWAAFDGANPIVYYLPGTIGWTDTFAERPTALWPPATLYVSLQSANPVAPYANWATAATNIQDAVDAAKAGDTVLVANGVYDVGGRAVSLWHPDWEPPQFESMGLSRVVVTKAIRVESVGGPSVTTIVGRRSWTNEFEEVFEEGGRCVYLGTNAVLSGFTLTNGASHFGAGVFCESKTTIVTNSILCGNRSGSDCGGPAGGGARGGTLYDCVLSGNSVTAPCQGFGPAGAGGGAFGSTLFNCTLSGNSVAGFAFGGGASGCTLYNCTVTGNSATQVGGGTDACTLYNCTVTGNSSGVGGCDSVFNSILYGNTNANYNACTTLNFCLTSPLPTNGIGNIDVDPRFVNAAAGDFRLRPDSPCIDKGTNLLGFTLTTTNVYTGEIFALSYTGNATDILGYPRGGDDNGDGKSGWDMGAYEYDPTVPIITQASITPAGLTIQWNATAIGAKLQRATSLTEPDWEEMLGSEKTNRVMLPIYSGNEFFRLVGQGNPDPQHLVWIPPGTFMMGSPTNEVDRYENEGPQTQVTLTKGFWMGKYEVTQGEYLAVMGTNPSRFQPPDFPADANRPVESVSWEDAASYCAKLTQRERLAGRIATNAVYRLPTEAEWEYACRAGTTTRFSYGDDPGYTNLTNYAWYSGNSGWQTHPVGQKLPNAWGLYDMHGNVFEWCQDWWSDNLPSRMVVDPRGPDTGSCRVIRGARYSDGMAWGFAEYCRSASRGHGCSPDDGNSKIGFRVVLAPGQP